MKRTIKVGRPVKGQATITLTIGYNSRLDQTQLWKSLGTFMLEILTMDQLVELKEQFDKARPTRPKGKRGSQGEKPQVSPLANNSEKDSGGD